MVRDAGDPASSDEAIRGRLDAGDVRGAAALAVGRVGPGVRGYLRTLLDEADADEAFSILEESLLRGLPGFRWEATLEAWVHRLAFHAANRIWRRPHRGIEVPLPSAASALGPGPSAAGRSGRHAGLALLRAGLTLEEQTLLALRVEQELGWEEIAVVLDGGAATGHRRAIDRRAATLRKRYERLTRRLREEARRHGLID
jgi:RNA polymerase sigma-70 factor (ECF subfamily)